MKFVIRDLPEHAESILKAIGETPALKEACHDYERLSRRLMEISDGCSEAQHLSEILEELKAEIVRLLLRAQQPEGGTA